MIASVFIFAGAGMHARLSIATGAMACTALSACGGASNVPVQSSSAMQRFFSSQRTTNNTWAAGPSLPVPREDFASAAKRRWPTSRYFIGVAAVNGILYTIGGCNKKRSFNIVEAYDPCTNTWSTKAPQYLDKEGGYAASRVPTFGLFYQWHGVRRRRTGLHAVGLT